MIDEPAGVGTIAELAETTARKEPMTRNDALRVAAKLIRTQGYHGTSTKMIADSLGIGKSTLFHHIKNKQDMLFEILNNAMESVHPPALEICSRDLSPSEKLKLIVENHISRLSEHLEAVGVLLQERNCLQSPYIEIIKPKREQYVQLFRGVIRDGIASGEFRPVNATAVTFAILGMCNWLVQWYDREGEISLNELAEMYSDLALRMVRP